jgi:hypothetical protein
VFSCEELNINAFKMPADKLGFVLAGVLVSAAAVIPDIPTAAVLDLTNAVIQISGTHGSPRAETYDRKHASLVLSLFL